MQRLFTTFPNSWPGAGLLLLRLTLSASLFMDRPRFAGTATVALLFDVMEMLVSCFLAVGLWTPVACIAQWLILIIAGLAHGAEPLRTVQAFTYLGLAMLGPGAWSVDARLFGRRRMNVEP